MKTILLIDNTIDGNDNFTLQLLRNLQQICDAVNVVRVKTQGECNRFLEPHAIRQVLAVVLSGSSHMLTSCTMLQQLSKDSSILLAILRLPKKRRPPILGVCYGMQLLCMLHGGAVGQLPRGDTITVSTRDTMFLHPSPIFPPRRRASRFAYFHDDYVTTLPCGWVATSYCIVDEVRVVSSCENAEGDIFCVQFHPEASGENGTRVLTNFINLVSP